MARKKGSKNQQKQMNTVEPSRCRVCQSTRRSDYDQKRVIEEGGYDNAGRPYSRVVYRPTKCLDCGQWRTDRTYEFEPDAVVQ